MPTAMASHRIRRPRAPARPTPERRLLALISAKTVETMIDAAFPVAASVVRCDFVSAFYRSTGPDGLLNERDSLGRTSGRDFMQRFTELTPALPLAIAHPGIRLLTTRGVLPASSRILRRTPFYREIMRPQGWRHGVSLCFWGEPRAESPIFVLSVYRRDERRDFGARDLAKLERMYPFFDFAVNRVCEWEARQMLQDGMAITTHTGPHGFAILDGSLKLLQANDEGHELCAAWDDAPATSGHTVITRRLPRDIARECRALHQDWRRRVRAGVGASGLRRRIAHPRYPGLMASITMIAPSTEGLSEPTFVLEFDRIREGDGVLQKLTTAERAVAIVIAGGFNNQEIAERLGKTVYAVKFLLHRIYEKTGVTNRAALVAMLR